MVIFHSYVKLPEGSSITLPQPSVNGPPRFWGSRDRVTLDDAEERLKTSQILPRVLGKHLYGYYTFGFDLS